MMYKFSLYVLLAWGLITGSSCHNGKPPAGDAAGPASADTLQHPIRIQYAKGFSISYHDHYKLLHIFNRLNNRTDTLQYLLVQAGHQAPAGFPNAQVITVPVKTLVGMSSMHVAEAEFAGIGDRITGLGSLQYISSLPVRQRIKEGKILAVGMEGNLNNELLISMHPGVLIASANPEAGFGNYATLIKAGIPVLLNTDWLENTPLGRAEWVKLLAALANQEETVGPKFDSLAAEYKRLAELGTKAAPQPSVIVGMPYKGDWFVPAGESYVAQFLRDAGAAYHWAGTSGVGSLSLNMEAVAPVALTADYWLNPGELNSRADIAAKDQRYTQFRSYKTGKVYNNNRLTNDLGSNDYWESGAVRPQIILADLIRILHPELLPDHALVYYKQLP